MKIQEKNRSLPKLRRTFQTMHEDPKKNFLKAYQQLWNRSDNSHISYVPDCSLSLWGNMAVMWHVRKQLIDIVSATWSTHTLVTKGISFIYSCFIQFPLLWEPNIHKTVNELFLKDTCTNFWLLSFKRNTVKITQLAICAV